jgi:outer membrane protein TolC
MNRTRRQALCLAGAFGLFLTPALRAQEPEKLTLKQTVTLAVQNSRELALARIQLSVAQGAARLDRSQFLPNLYSGSGAAYSNGFPQTPSGAAPSLFNMSYIQTLFNPPMRGQYHAAQERAQGRQQALERTRDAVIVNAATDYLELVKVRGSRDWLRQERESALKVLQVARQRAAAGLELPMEITRAELAQARVEQRLIQIEGRDEVLEEDLRNLIGAPAGRPLELAAEPLAAGADQPVGELVAEALENNPDVKEAEQERRARQDILKGERGGYWPSIDFVGQYSLLSRINNYDQFFRTFQRHNLNVGVQVQIPIFSARTAASVGLARSQLTEAELELGNRRAALDVQVHKEFRQTRELDATQEVARLELKLAQESLAVVQSRFDQGRANLAELEQARLEESEKWLGFLDADFQRQRAQLELWKTTGQLAKVFQ